MTPEDPGIPEEKAEERAKAIAEGGEGHDIEDEEAAARAAQATLEESEERTFDPATKDPHDDGVIRRDSKETAARGDTPE